MEATEGLNSIENPPMLHMRNASHVKIIIEENSQYRIIDTFLTNFMVQRISKGFVVNC